MATIVVPKQLSCRKELVKALPRKLVCAEVGVYRGLFSSVILTYARPSKLYMVDCWRGGVDAATDVYDEDPKMLHAMRNAMFRMRWWIKKGVAMPIIGRTPDAASMFEDEELDFIYIDASHDYHSTINDLMAWAPKVRCGGIVAGHDYDCEGTKENKQDWGVKQAVDEFCASNGIEKIGTTQEDVKSYYFNRPKELVL